MDINISQDIRKFKTKDIGNFSIKEVGFLVIGAALGVGTYMLCNEVKIAIIPFALVAVFAFLKPFGMSFFQFIKTWGKETVSPKTYIWETDFEYDYDEILKLYGDGYYLAEPEELTQSNSDSNKK